MSKIKRWYDKSPKLQEMLIVLSNLSDDELDKIAIYLYQVVNLYRKQKKNKDEVVSLGRDKLFNYYKAYQKRRWYDKNSSLSSSLNIMSTLAVKELEEIVDGFLYALKEANMYKIYSSKRKEIIEKETT